MGSPTDEPGRDADEGPRRDVEIGAFRMQRTPVTVAQFEQRLEELRELDAEARWWFETETPEGWLGSCNLGSERLTHPMNCVSWRAARAYCQSVGGVLPTEAEWEQAARAFPKARSTKTGSAEAFWWGADFEPAHVVSSVGCGERGCAGGTAPVVEEGPRCNGRGLCDLVGNVWEWTTTDYQEQLGPYVNRLTDTDAPERPVHKGGAWLNHVPTLFRTAHRGLNYPNHGLTGVGFRCVQRLPAR